MKAPDNVEEEAVFTNLERKRQKCLDFLMGGEPSSHQVKKEVDLFTRLQEIREWEELLGEMWNRLEIDARKGDPSFVLKRARTPAENWIASHVTPSLLLRDLFEITGMLADGGGSTASEMENKS